MDAMASPLPLFPLQTVLFPGGLLPLRIFEVRYLDLMGRCHREGLPFGVVTLIKGQEVRAAGAPEELFHEVGTLATITQFDRPQQGVMMVRCEGSQRFRIKARQRLPHGLWVATQMQPLPDDQRIAVPDELKHLSSLLQQMVANLRSQPGRSDDVHLKEPCLWDDCGWLANRWCELLPVQTELKLRCMALENPVLRLELVDDMLDRLGIKGAAR